MPTHEPDSAPVVLFAILVLIGCSGCSKSGDEIPVAEFLNASTDIAFVGDAECATCHEDEYEGYQAHGMAQGFRQLTSENAVEDYSGVAVRHPQTGYYYVAGRNGDRFVQEEYIVDEAGRKTHSLVRTMDYFVGSGSAARTFLTGVEGRLYELPLTWYTQANGGEGRWDFSPGYRDSNGRFDRAIPEGCMACHNGTSEPVPYVPGKFQTLAMGIGCEQCHGPGQLHVEARLADPEAADSVDLTIVNPAHLTLERRLDVCQQCHLSGAVSVLREGETSASFRPSQALEDHIAIFGREEPSGETISVISHADRMKQSACFRQSEVMDCVTCHNPHEGFRDAGPSYFNDTCIDCHSIDALQDDLSSSSSQPDHVAESDCFSCHMPKTEADDAPHSSFTDHFIRVVGEDRVSFATSSESGVVLTPHFERDRQGPEAAVYTAMAYVVFGRQNGDRNALEEGTSRLARALPERPELGEAQYLLGFARLQLGQATAAIEPLEESVRLNAEIPERLNTLAQAYEATGKDPSNAERLYRRALEIQPAQASIRVNLGRILELRGNTEAALREYERAVSEEPWLAAAHYNRGTALLRLSRLVEGERALEEAIHLDPNHSDALTNLGVLAGGRGEAARATAYFERAVEADSRNANALANLALAMASAGDMSRARHYAERALAIDPGHVVAQQVMTAS